METTHTPGPWLSKEGMVYAEDGDGATLAHVRYEPDAHLIAAAPDLLAACEQATEYIDRPDIDDDSFTLSVVRRLLSAAIARATVG